MKVVLPAWLYYYVPELIYNDAQTWTSFYLNLFTNLISVISCLVILYVIFRSNEGLRTTYHRIIAFFAVMCLVSNISVGAGTLPMPKDNVYPFKGPMLGNDATCTAQAFAITFTQFMYVPCNTWLAIYYVCVLVLKLKPRTISRCIEPIFYLISVGTSIAGSVIYMKYEYFNVHPLIPHCYTARYPFHCTWFPDGEECYNNGSFLYTEKGYIAQAWSSLGYLYVLFGLLIICMLTIIVNTYLFERRNKVRSTSSTTPQEQENQQGATPEDTDIFFDHTTTADVSITNADLKFTRIVSFQAMLYILSFFITWIPVSTVSLVSQYSDTVVDGIAVYVRIFLQNLEGFFIMCIFLYHKVHNIRRSKKRSDMPVCEALALLFSSQEVSDDAFLENLTMVLVEIDDIRQRREAAIQAEMDDANVLSHDLSHADSKPNTAELEKYEGLSFVSPPGVSYNVSEASSVGKSSSVGPSVENKILRYRSSTPTSDDISYDVSKVNGQSLPLESASGGNSYGGEESSC